MSATKTSLVKAAEELVAVAQKYLDFWNKGNMDEQNFWELQAGGLNLVRILGDAGKQWASAFKPPDNIRSNPTQFFSYFYRMNGTAAAILAALRNDLLLEIERIVAAETFSDLLEQAEHLRANSYFLPAAVIGRAVLEEHLRKLCDMEGCVPAKARPMINDFKDELYKRKLLSNVEMKQVEVMATVGNGAAHNLPTFKKEHVEGMLRDV